MEERLAPKNGGKSAESSTFVLYQGRPHQVQPRTVVPQGQVRRGRRATIRNPASRAGIRLSIRNPGKVCKPKGPGQRPRRGAVATKIEGAITPGKGGAQGQGSGWARAWGGGTVSRWRAGLSGLREKSGGAAAAVKTQALGRDLPRAAGNLFPSRQHPGSGALTAGGRGGKGRGGGAAPAGVLCQKVMDVEVIRGGRWSVGPAPRSVGCRSIRALPRFG